MHRPVQPRLYQYPIPDLSSTTTRTRVTVEPAFEMGAPTTDLAARVATTIVVTSACHTHTHTHTHTQDTEAHMRR